VLNISIGYFRISRRFLGLNRLYKSLTWDRGKELTDHRRFTLATNIDVYFCAIDATQALNLSAGVSNPKVSRGRSLS
jgi:hypothetical protein